jgi:hypothetical protein
MPDHPAPAPSGAGDHAGRAALERLLAIAQTDTGQSRLVADFLLAWWNAQSCGGFDPTSLWSLEPAIRNDTLAVLHLIAHHREHATAYDHGDAFAALVRRWRPHITESVR